jgi:tetratricopeptide (TPR) repeat protein
MKTRLAFFLLATLASASFCHAQGSQPQKPPPTPMSTSTPPADPAGSMNRDWDKVLTGGRSGDFLAGNVVLMDNALPWDAIPVTVSCNGQVRFTTYTDRKGNFTIARSEAMGSKTINADPKPVAVQFVGCSVEAWLAGFDSSPLSIANRHVLDSVNIGTITLRREAGAEGSALSTTTSAAPKDALRSFEKARGEAFDNKPDRAQHDLQKAVEIYPAFAEAWFQLGKIQAAANSPDAYNSFSKAIAADPKFSLPYDHIAPLAAQAGKWQELVDLTSQALVLNPRGNIELWYYHAFGNYQVGKLDVAETSAAKSLAMDPLHFEPNTEQLLAVILAQKPDLPAAIEHLRNCVTYFPPGPKLDLVKQQLAQLEHDNAGFK